MLQVAAAAPPEMAVQAPMKMAPAAPLIAAEDASIQLDGGVQPVYDYQELWKTMQLCMTGLLEAHTNLDAERANNDALKTRVRDGVFLSGPCCTIFANKYANFRG